MRVAIRRKRKYRCIVCVWVDTRSVTCYMYFWRILNPDNIKGISIKVMEHDLFRVFQSFQ